MGSWPASPNVFAPPFGSRQNSFTVLGKNGPVSASSTLPPPSAHAPGLPDAAGGGGGSRRDSSSFLDEQPAPTRMPMAMAMTEVDFMRSCESVGKPRSGLAPFFIPPQSLAPRGPRPRRAPGENARDRRSHAARTQG